MSDKLKKENNEISCSTDQTGKETLNSEPHLIDSVAKDYLESPEGDSVKRKWEEDEGVNRKNEKLKHRGMNKNRGPTFRVEQENELCPRLVDRQSDSDSECKVEGCKFMHDVNKYFEQKLPSLGEECYVYKTTGHCPRGITCRFSSKHITERGLNIINKTLHEEWKSNTHLHTVNKLSYEVLVQLRKKAYNFDKSEDVLSRWHKENEMDKAARLNTNGQSENGSSEVLESKTARIDDGDVNDNTDSVVDDQSKMGTSGDSEVHLGIGPVLDSDIIKLRNEEKRKIDWRGKLILSPLTTVGNLPFRRICKEFGADVTCGEMALATSLLQGKQQEWALTKRHGSEDLFGVQVCGANANVMTRCAQLVTEQANVDFMDINVGCPIDLIFRQGAGSGLLKKKKVLFSIVKCMKSVLDIPLTVKMRMGVYSGKNVAHTFMKDLSDAGADIITIHGRSKEQRYTKLADWAYVEQCAQLAAPTPVIGNGDILSYEDYDRARERSPSVTSIMIGRGALMKPWIFTELKERRHWDISSRERFQILQNYTQYGLEHWGSDTKGVECTRGFLLEWLSFLYRYVPVGLLETPQKMNERPPNVEFRDDLEALMASSNCADWIKISEMLLGPVPPGFHFLPKHKANAWT